MSSIYKRASDGVWVGVVDLPKVDGKRKRKPFYVEGEKSDAKAKRILESKIRELEYQLENNIYRDPGNSTIKSLISEYNEHHKDIAVTTQALHLMYERKHICPDKGGLGYVKLKDVVPAMIEKFYQAKMTGENKLSSNTIIKLHSFLHAAFQFAVKNRMVLVNPLDAVKCPKKVKFKPRIPTDAEFFTLLETSKGTFDEVAILLAGGLSLCRGEICGLKWSDIDWENQNVTVEETHVHFDKNIRKEPKAEARHRTMYSPKFILDTLQKYKSSLKNPGTYICEYKPDAYGKHFKKLAEKYGMQGLTLHKLRHFNATLMMKLNVPDKVGAGRTGHSQLSTYQEVYLHATQDSDKIASDKIDNFLQLH
jgi:integrase